MKKIFEWQKELMCDVHRRYSPRRFENYHIIFGVRKILSSEITTNLSQNEQPTVTSGIKSTVDR